MDEVDQFCRINKLALRIPDFYYYYFFCQLPLQNSTWVNKDVPTQFSLFFFLQFFFSPSFPLVQLSFYPVHQPLVCFGDFSVFFLFPQEDSHHPEDDADAGYDEASLYPFTGRVQSLVWCAVNVLLVVVDVDNGRQRRLQKRPL